MNKFAQHRITELKPANQYDYRSHHSIETPLEWFDEKYFQSLFDSIDEYLIRWDIDIHQNCRYQQIKAELTLDIKNWGNINFQRFYMAMRDLSLLSAIIQTTTTEGKLPQSLRRALSEDALVPQVPNDRSPGRDHLFELFVGSFFRAAGCDVVTAEPDWQCRYHSFQFGAAAKRCSLNSIENHVKKARDQIANTGKRGMIMLDVSHNDPFNFRKIFVGTREDYRRHVHTWMAERLVKPLQRKARSWRVQGENIPGIFSFYFGIHFDTERDSFNIFHHFNVYSVEYSRELTSEEWYEDYLFNKLVFALRSTLPVAGLTFPQVKST